MERHVALGCSKSFVPEQCDRSGVSETLGSCDLYFNLSFAATYIVTDEAEF